MLTMQMIKNHDFGTIHIQRFKDSNMIRVHVMKSVACPVELLNEEGTSVTDPFMDVSSDDDIPQAIVELWRELRRRLYYGRTGRRNAHGLFFHDPLPDELVAPF